MKGPLDPSDSGGTRHNTCDLIRLDFKDAQEMALLELSLKAESRMPPPETVKPKREGGTVSLLSESVGPWSLT